MAESKEMVDRIAAADPEALTQCLRLMNTGEDEHLSNEMFEALDSACILYAMGGGSSENESEWRKFREIVRYTARLDAQMEEIYENGSKKDGILFEIAVLEAMRESEIAEVARQRIDDEVEMTRYGLDFLQEELEKAVNERDFCLAWLHVAKSLLTHPRFTKLSDDDFDELVEAVTFALESDGDDDFSYDEEDDE